MADNEYERGFKDGLKSECLKELKPLMVELTKGCTEAIKGIPTRLIDNANLTIRHAVNCWISVEDALPEVWKEVLVVLNSNGYQSICIGEIQESGEWMVNGEFWYDKGDPSITHWMHLPEIPEPPEKE